MKESGFGPAAFGFRSLGTLGGEALEQLGRRLVGRVLRHQLATKSLGEQGWGQLADLPAGGGETGFEAVGEGEEDFDAADDFGLFVYWWQLEGDLAQDAQVNVLLRGCRSEAF